MSNSQRGGDPYLESGGSNDIMKLTGSKNHTKLDVNVHDHTALHYSLDQSSKTFDRSHTMMVQNQVVI
jgi:hypothetical protein